MVYNFNLGIGWASSGVEYAQISYDSSLPSHYLIAGIESS